MLILKSMILECDWVWSKIEYRQELNITVVNYPEFYAPASFWCRNMDVYQIMKRNNCHVNGSKLNMYTNTRWVGTFCIGNLMIKPDFERQKFHRLNTCLVKCVWNILSGSQVSWKHHMQPYSILPVCTDYVLHSCKIGDWQFDSFYHSKSRMWFTEFINSMQFLINALKTYGADGYVMNGNDKIFPAWVNIFIWCP